MDYKEFYKNELFPENEVFITDALLEKNNWDDKMAIDDDCQSYCLYNDIGRINILKDYYGKGKNLYTLCIDNTNNDYRKVRTFSDIKAAIYSYLCGQTVFKYGPDENGLYGYHALENEEEMAEWRYNEYCKMMKCIEKT
jgi:hypothetical protein